jgi:hypothetical protein
MLHYYFKEFLIRSVIAAGLVGFVWVFFEADPPGIFFGRSYFEILSAISISIILVLFAVWLILQFAVHALRCRIRLGRFEPIAAKDPAPKTVSDWALVGLVAAGFFAVAATTHVYGAPDTKDVFAVGVAWWGVLILALAYVR